MSELDKLLLKLKKQKNLIINKFNVKRIGIFGSFLRGEQKKNSDLDILIEFNKPIGLLAFVTLEQELSKYSGKKVDLVMKSALKPVIGRHILKEVLYI